MDLTPSIKALKEQIKQLEKIVSDLEYQQILNKAVNNAKNKQHETNNSSTKCNTLSE